MQQNLTLGASGSTYTAPANGWVVFNITYYSSTVSDVVNLYAVSPRIGIAIHIPEFSYSKTGQGYMLTIPIKAGQTFATDYGVNIKSKSLRFYYAEGTPSA